MKHRILAVDDEPNICRLLQVNLERQGYEVRTASNGVQAWKLLQAEPFDLVITDTMMPEMDGLELEEKVRDDQNLKGMPVIFLSSRPAESNSGYDQGYVSRDRFTFWFKPFSPQSLVEFIKKMLSNRRQEDREDDEDQD